MNARYAPGLLAAACLLVAAPDVSLAQEAAASQAPAAEAREKALRQRITASLDWLAARLEAEALAGSNYVAQVQTAPATDLTTVIEQARTQKSGISKLIAAAPMDVARQANSQVQFETSRRLAVEDMRGKVTELRKYAQHLRNLKSASESAPIDQVLHSLETEFVPDNVAIVIGPSERPPSVPAEPQPFVGSPPVSGLVDDLLPFVVGLGATTVDYPAVGAIQFLDSATGGLSVQCTGTLVGENTVLTAQHCLAAGEPKSVFFQHAGTYEVQQPPLRLDHFHFPERDLMLLYLKKRVTGITPIEPYDSSAIAEQMHGQIIGFGYHRPFAIPGAPAAPQDAVLSKTGVKLFAQVTTDTCDGDFSDKNLICWSYPNTQLQPLQGSTCHGDSGGPLFVFTDKWRIAGVTSGGTGCVPGDKAFDTEVFAYRKWLRKAIDHPPVQLPAATTNLRSLSPVLNAQDRYPIAISERVLDSTGKWTRTFSILADVDVIRLAINAVTSGSSLGLSVQTSIPAMNCEQHLDATTASCEFSAPPQGEWSLTVSGLPLQEFQVVATVF